MPVKKPNHQNEFVRNTFATRANIRTTFNNVPDHDQVTAWSDSNLIQEVVGLKSLSAIVVLDEWGAGKPVTPWATEVLWSLYTPSSSTSSTHECFSFRSVYMPAATKRTSKARGPTIFKSTKAIDGRTTATIITATRKWRQDTERPGHPEVGSAPLSQRVDRILQPTGLLHAPLHVHPIHQRCAPRPQTLVDAEIGA